MDIMVNKVRHHIKKHSRNLHLGLFISLILSGSLLAYIGYFDKILFSKSPAKNSDQVVLYYHKAALGAVVCNNLYPIYRTIPTEQKTAESIVGAVIAGPTSREKKDGYISIYSPETQSIVQSIYIKDRTANINLYDIRKIFPPAAKCLQESVISPIEKALQANLGINKVIFAINSKPEDFYNWMGIACSILNGDCYKKEFVTGTKNIETKTINSVTGKIQFNLPQNWYAQLDGYSQIEDKYRNILTATRVLNWNELESKSPPDNGVQMTIIELGQSDKSTEDLLECSKTNTCTTENRNNIEIKKNSTVSNQGLFETYSFTKDNKTYVIEIQFPYTNSANREYDVTQNIINDLIVHI